MSPLRIIISWDGDHIGRVVGRATLEDDVEEVRRVDQAINRGNDIFRSWTLANTGSIIEIGGDEGRVEVPVDALKDLEGIRQNYASAVGATVSIGIGKKLSESAKSLLAAKLRGGDRIVFWSPEVGQEVAEAKEKSEGDKISEAYLKKDEGSAGTPDKKDIRVQTAEHSQGEAARHQAGGPLAEFHAAAQQAVQQDRAKSVQQSSDYHDIRQAVAGALQNLRTQLPVLQQLKSAYPDTYKSVLELVQSVIVMARGLESTDSKLEKAAKTPKVWKEYTGGFGAGIQIPGSNHPDRPKWDADYMSSLKSNYGDISSIKDIDISRLEAGNSGTDIHNKDRYRLYHRMLSAGDTIPPLAVMPQGESFKVVDGTHRLEAARATKKKTVPAVVVRKDQMFDTQPQLGTALDKALPDMKAKKISGPAVADTEHHEEYDYDHMLPPNSPPGMTMRVSHAGPDAYRVDARHNNQNVGTVKCYIYDAEESRNGNSPVVEPHSQLQPMYRGKGLGTAMYEAAYSHAKNHLGVNSVEGGIHSDDASKVHQRLAAKHGFEYKQIKRPGADDIDDDDDGDFGNFSKYPNDDYHYHIKAEDDFGIDESEMTPVIFGRGIGKEEVEPDQDFPDDKTLDKASETGHAPNPGTHAKGSPVGTLHNGKLKVEHADGTKGWKGVRAGMIAGQEAGAPLFGANTHPVSSREPGSK